MLAEGLTLLTEIARRNESAIVELERPVLNPPSHD